MSNLSLKTVEKSVESLAKELRKKGFDVNVESVELGRGNASYVEIEVEKYNDFWFTANFISNGYAADGADDYSTAHGMKKAKSEFLESLIHSFSEYNYGILQHI